MTWRVRVCSWIGHDVATRQTDQVISFVGCTKGDGSDDHWCWPGVISWCRRCDLIFKASGPPPHTPTMWTSHTPKGTTS